MAGCGIYYTRQVELTSLWRQGRATGVRGEAAGPTGQGRGAGHAENRNSLKLLALLCTDKPRTYTT